MINHATKIVLCISLLASVSFADETEKDYVLVSSKKLKTVIGKLYERVTILENTIYGECDTSSKEGCINIDVKKIELDEGYKEILDLIKED